MTDKACAVVLHPAGAPLRFLAFRHPQAGVQLVKGGIAAGETALAAARRELWEETGLTARSGRLIATSDTIQPGEVWHLCLLRVALPVADRWPHRCTDDGGHDFDIFWHPLDAPSPFTGRFARAYSAIRDALELGPC